MREPDHDAGDVRHQLLAAYCASGAKVLAWAVAAAVVYRRLGPGPFALLMLLRGTLGLFNHAAFGLGPAVLHFTALARRRTAGEVVLEAAEVAPQDARSPTLDYADAAVDRDRLRVAPGASAMSVHLHAAILTLPLLSLGLAALAAYDANFPRIHDIAAGTLRTDLQAVWLVGGGVLLRAVGDVAGGTSQATGRFVADQLLAAAADVVWGVACVALFLSSNLSELKEVATLYMLTGFLAVLPRAVVARLSAGSCRPAGGRRRYAIGFTFALRLLAYGGLVTLGGVADFLYAPIDYVILNKLVDPLAVAVYAPAIQVDAALILLVTAVAAVVLPRSAIRHANRDAAGVWREYVRAAVASAGVTVVGGVGVYLLSPYLFTLWLGDSLPATRAILPLVLAHTVIGASAGVGRATLLAVGKAGAYAASVLVGGLLNVGLSLWFVHLGLGLRGVIWGTLASVFLRCVLWLPWYVRRTLRA